MRRLVGTYATLALALWVALAGLTQAGALGAAGHSLVICTGDGLVRITLAPDGSPVEHTLPCSDCVLTPSALLPDGVSAPASLQPTQGAVVPRSTVWAGASAGLWAEGRSPPTLA